MILVRWCGKPARPARQDVAGWATQPRWRVALIDAALGHIGADVRHKPVRSVVGIGGRRGRARRRRNTRSAEAAVRASGMPVRLDYAERTRHVRFGYRERRRRAKLRRRARDRDVELTNATRRFKSRTTWARSSAELKLRSRGAWWTTPEGRRDWLEQDRQTKRWRRATTRLRRMPSAIMGER